MGRGRARPSPDNDASLLVLKFNSSYLMEQGSSCLDMKANTCFCFSTHCNPSKAEPLAFIYFNFRHLSDAANNEYAILKA